MRILHTSDWHLGRSFHRQGMLDAQARFVDWVVDVVRNEGIGAVVVAGDIYDRALPPVDAVRLCSEALQRLVDTGAQVVLLSGNHDSASRLGFGASLLGAAGVHISTDPHMLHRPIVLRDADAAVAVYAIPYLEPDAVAGPLGCTGRGHAAVMGEAMRRVRADLSTREVTHSVVAAHAFVTGAQACESERDISVGGVSAVPAGVFDGIDHVALGHLHGPQSPREHVHYSGSPLAYSFSEQHHRKSVTIVDLDSAGTRTTRLDAPVERGLATLRGRLSDLLSDPCHEPVRDRFLQVVLTDAVRPREPMEQLRARFPYVLVLRMEPEGRADPAHRSYAERVRGLDDGAVAASFVEHVRGSAASDRENELLRAAFETTRRISEAVA